MYDDSLFLILLLIEQQSFRLGKAKFSQFRSEKTKLSQFRHTEKDSKNFVRILPKISRYFRFLRIFFVFFVSFKTPPNFAKNFAKYPPGPKAASSYKTHVL